MTIVTVGHNRDAPVNRNVVLPMETLAKLSIFLWHKSVIVSYAKQVGKIEQITAINFFILALLRR